MLEELFSDGGRKVYILQLHVSPVAICGRKLGTQRAGLPLVLYLDSTVGGKVKRIRDSVRLCWRRVINGRKCGEETYFLVVFLDCPERSLDILNFNLHALFVVLGKIQFIRLQLQR